MTESGRPVFNCATETYRHPNRITFSTNVSSALNLEFDCETFSKTLHIISRQLVFASKTDSYRVIILIFTVLYRYSDHVTFVQIL